MITLRVHTYESHLYSVGRVGELLVDCLPSDGRQILEGRVFQFYPEGEEAG